MTAAEKRDLSTRADVFKALGHPTRLAMVMALGDGERCVCELVELVKLDTSTVSKHLSLLRTSGLVTCEKRGKQVFYSLRMHCAVDFVTCVDRAICDQKGS